MKDNEEIFSPNYMKKMPSDKLGEKKLDIQIDMEKYKISKPERKYRKLRISP